MGSDQSKFDEPLPQQPEPICAVEPRFCLPTPVQLRLREKIMSFSKDDFSISDANTGLTYFQCQGKMFSIRDRKVLLDNTGVPVLNLKEQFISFLDKYQVHAGDSSDRLICKFKTEITFIRSRLSTQFTDVINNKSRQICLHGNWREKQCVIFLGEPKHGGVPIAKIFRPTSGRSLLFGVDEYFIEIAAGVDVALMVIICIALDEHKRDG